MYYTSTDVKRLQDEGRLFVRLRTRVDGGRELPIGTQVPKGMFPLSLLADLLNSGKFMTDERMSALGIKPPDGQELPKIQPKPPVAVRLPGRKGI